MKEYIATYQVGYMAQKRVWRPQDFECFWRFEAKNVAQAARISYDLASAARDIAPGIHGLTPHALIKNLKSTDGRIVDVKRYIRNYRLHKGKVISSYSPEDKLLTAIFERCHFNREKSRFRHELIQ